MKTITKITIGLAAIGLGAAALGKGKSSDDEDSPSSCPVIFSGQLDSKDKVSFDLCIRNLMKPEVVQNALSVARTHLGKHKSHAEDVVFDLVVKVCSERHEEFGSRDLRPIGLFIETLKKNAKWKYSRLEKSSDVAERNSLVAQQIFGEVPSESGFDYSETVPAILRVLNRLDDDLRQAFILFYLEGKSFSEVATCLGVSKLKATTWAHTARIYLWLYVARKIFGWSAKEIVSKAARNKDISKGLSYSAPLHNIRVLLLGTKGVGMLIKRAKSVIGEEAWDAPIKQNSAGTFCVLPEPGAPPGSSVSITPEQLAELRYAVTEVWHLWPSAVRADVNFAWVTNKASEEFRNELIQVRETLMDIVHQIMHAIDTGDCHALPLLSESMQKAQWDYFRQVSQYDVFSPGRQLLQEWNRETLDLREALDRVGELIASFIA